MLNIFKKNHLDISYTKTYSYAYDNIRFLEILVHTIKRTATNEIRISINGNQGYTGFSLSTYHTQDKGLTWKLTRSSIRFNINELYCLNNTVKEAIKEFAKIQTKEISEPKILKTLAINYIHYIKKAQILIKQHKNNLCLDFRIYITNDNGLTWKPTKDGICFYTNELFDLQSAIEKAIIIAKKERYL